MTHATDLTRQQQRAATDLAFATSALQDAERSHARRSEIIALCDDVIRQRLRVQAANMEAGWEPSAAQRAQMLRDRMLLEHSLDTNHPHA